jgi:polyphosphate:AMP phosphotransferase
MFESAELGHAVDKRTYRREAPRLRGDLLDAQADLFEKAEFAVIVLIAGVDGAGKGETVNVLNEWMDPRHIQTHALGEPTEDERALPPMWRYWHALPPKGKIGIFFGSWYTEPIQSRVHRQTKRSDLTASIDEIVRFERMLTHEGVLLLKLWFHLSKAEQRKRLRALEKDKRTRWRVTKEDWKAFALYDRYRKVSERTLRQTSTAEAPWTVIEGVDARYRYMTAGRTLLQALRQRLDTPAERIKTQPPAPIAPAGDGKRLLESLDLSAKLPKKRYEEQLEEHQGTLNRLSRDPRFRDRALVVVFEGVDAAGKGGTIRRITAALDARVVRVVPIAAPTEEERAQPYLWRFWRNLPRRGHVTIFDRSWYGRVLVERVEGLAQPAAWTRAYSEINDFEEQLVTSGVVVVKLWLAISKEEQIRRFKAREATRFKRYKITAEDWRNREKWGDYQAAAGEMIDRTSTEIAPWTLVPANDKYCARIKTLETVATRLADALRHAHSPE